MIEGLEKIINQAVSEKAFPGACYALVTKNKSFFGCVGNKSLLPVVEKNQIDTIYDLASMSKVISTTTCAMILVERGVIRLFDKVQRYIPEYRHEKVTIYDLMTHTSGMKPYLSNVHKLKNAQEVWDNIINLDLEYETGSKIVYSCLNYIILGKIIERTSKMGLDEFAKKEIFEPLEMTDTSYNPKDIMRCAPTELRNDELFKGILQGRVHDETAYLLNGISGNAGVFSTVKDLSHFIEMVLNDGVYHGKRILSKATIDLFFTPQVEEKQGVYLVRERRSIGWIVKGMASSAGELTSAKTILHTGFTGTNIWIDYDNQIGFCLLSNRVHPSRDSNLHIEYRAKIANYLIAHIAELNEVSND